MFDISFWEICVVLVVALIVLGPQQMLRMSYKMGRWARYFRHSFSAISNEINQQLNVEMEIKPSTPAKKTLEQVIPIIEKATEIKHEHTDSQS